MKLDFNWRAGLLAQRELSPPVLLIVFILLCAVSCVGSQERVGLAPGLFPPKANLVDLKGETVTLKDYRGKVVLINLWATWCTPCVIEMPELEKLYKELHPKGFEIVAIAVDDTTDRVKEFVQDHKLSFPVLISKSGATKTSFDASGLPESFFLNRKGSFVLFSDPESGQSSVRIIGPREWASQEMRESIELLLK